MHRALVQEIARDAMTTEETQEREDSSIFGVAVAQWLFWISKRHPFMDKSVAKTLFLSLLLLPLVAAIVCFLLGQVMLGGIFTVLFLAALFLILLNASKHSRYAFTEKAARMSLQTLQFRFGQVRAKRTTDYDLYLPPGQKTTIQCACLLIPNEKVDRLAYSNIASIMSDAGILVVVQNTEPHCLPCTLHGSGVTELADIQRRVEQDFTVNEWAIAGHGTGGLVGSLVAEKLDIQKLVIWGACPFWNVDLSDSKLAVLVVIGSNDGYWTDMTEEQQNAYKSMLPPRNQKSVFMEIVKGANHAGFAYGPIPGDGEQGIRLEEQQKKASHLTVLFLKNAQSGTYVPPSSASV